ncbi:MAG: non-canonical purine NTP pyrophosphatase, RdgB/HAM1 family [Candidatus Melainabacteria bacterium RIFCSPHIGHO2_02_FULL_34_12]|nr:MAG: non-canonical purine NTP pyrophosphatase, RdgB/HAM1 family [Candidatus Melainabacteria bacterium RIFCSPHIGHO2_02_FULL_34_12]
MKEKSKNLTIYFASSNKDKLKEIKSILNQLKIKNIKLESAPGSFSVKENRKTFLENAYKKASALSKKVKAIAFADDSGIEVFAMNRRPGIKSSRFFRGGKGMTEIVEYVKTKKNKKCCFTCALVATDKNGKVIFKIVKSWYGKVSDEPRGKNGFGYDPIFIVPKYNKTSAQISPSLKNKLSHRYMATLEFARWLRKKTIAN